MSDHRPGYEGSPSNFQISPLPPPPPYEPGPYVPPPAQQQVPAPKRAEMPAWQYILFGVLGGAALIFGFAGVDWAEEHKPTLANALAGKTMYSDAGALQIGCVVLMIVGLALIAWPFILKAFRK